MVIMFYTNSERFSLQCQSWVLANTALPLPEAASCHVTLGFRSGSHSLKRCLVWGGAGGRETSARVRVPARRGGTSRGCCAAAGAGKGKSGGVAGGERGRRTRRPASPAGTDRGRGRLLTDVLDEVPPGVGRHGVGGLRRLGGGGALLSGRGGLPVGGAGTLSRGGGAAAGAPLRPARGPSHPRPLPTHPRSPAGLSRRAILVEGAGGAERRGQQLHGRRRQAAAEQLRRR